jgi:hypothetical protein
LFDFFRNLKKNSSLKIPLLHHAASFGLSVEGGGMVKEWDFEAGIFLKKSKRIIYLTLFYVLLPLLAFFSVIHGVSLHKTG